VKKIILISLAVHLILGIALAPWLKTRMLFDENEEAQRTEEVKKRELARQKFERLKRDRQKLDKKTARMLKKEAERKKRQDIVRRTEELKKLRDKMLERQAKALAQLHERKKEDVIKAEATRFEQNAETIVERTKQMQSAMNSRNFCLGAFQNGHDWGANGLFDTFSVHQGALKPPFARTKSLHHFAFDGDTLDLRTGQEGVTHHGGKIVDLPEGGQAFQSNGSNARVEFWPFEVERNFTLVTRLKLGPKTGQNSEKYQGLISNTHSNAYNRGFRVYVEANDGTTNPSTVVLETTASDKRMGLQTRTKPGAFTFNEWHELALVINREEDWSKIYLDGIDVTASEDELAQEFPTDHTTLDGTTEEMAADLQDLVQESPPTPDTAAGFKDKLAELDQKLDQRMDEHATQHDVRNDITKAKEAIAEMSETLDGLPQKTKMAEMNDTSDSVADKMDPAIGAGSSPAELYKEAQEIEKQISEAYADISAAKKATTENSSFSDARKSTPASVPARPDLASKLAGESSGTPKTVGELNEFRKNLDRAANEVGDMTARAQSMLGGAQNRSITSMRSGNVFASQAARQRLASMTSRYGAVVNMTSFGLGEGEGDSSGLRADLTGEGASMAAGKKQESIRLDEHDIIAKALPGRRFTEESARRGWLYLDTWYVIGPWENESKVNFEKSHPPEYEIDFDAHYFDGKFSNRDDHPDQALKWEFYQSDSVRCQPPRVYGAATYYAYTELYFEQAREILIAVASDDAASMWLNDQIIWQDTGQSSWSLGEGYRRVNMRKGFNTLLVRIENGPTHCVWSVLLCPPEAAEK